MPKHATTKTDFGKRLARLRKAAGYTQLQLAEEIGATRRVIAYYETESEHPPASLLVDLAKALNVSTDQLLGLSEIQAKQPGRMSSRLARRLKQIEQLNPKPKQQIIQLIDTFIEAERLKEQAHGNNAN